MQWQATVEGRAPLFDDSSALAPRLSERAPLLDNLFPKFRRSCVQCASRGTGPRFRSSHARSETSARADRSPCPSAAYLVAMKQLPAAAVRGDSPSGHQLAEGARGNARVGDGLVHGHPGGGCLRPDPVGQPRGDASRYLIGEHGEVELEPQRRPRRRSDVRKVGTQP